MPTLKVLHGVNVRPEHLEGLCRDFPDVEFVVQTPHDVDAMRAASREAEVIFAKGLPHEVVRAARRLRWVQAGTAGVNHLLQYPELRDTDVLVTNARGAHGIPMAENILALALAFTIGLPELLSDQREHGRGRLRHVIRTKTELHGQTMLVAGLGDIGGTLAIKSQALGMHVLGIRRHPRPTPGVDETLRREDLHAALARADHVALCLPLTPETDRYLGPAEFRAMKPGAFVYNVGRGRSIDTDALVQALLGGRLGGAGLDVTDPEPLPTESVLWDMPNVLLTQHSSGSSPYNSERITQIFSDNLRRFLGGQPLLNLVDKELGY